MSNGDLEIPVLFSNNEKESKEVYHVLKKAEIPFKHPASTEHGPLLVIGSTYHIGLLAIKKFTKSEKAQEIKKKHKK